MKRSASARGLTVVEVLITGALLATCICTMVLATTRSMMDTRQSAEYEAAALGARQMLEQLSSLTFQQICATYKPSTGQVGAQGGTTGNTFNVTYAATVQNSDLYLPGAPSGQPAGTIWIVTSEAATSASYGPNLSGGTTPGGVHFTGLPIDLDLDGATTNGELWNSTTLVLSPAVKRLPVGVVICWQGSHGVERYELWTILSMPTTSF